MLVSHQKKFIYLKCGKTASTSTEALLQPLCGDTKLRTNVTQVSRKGIISHPFHALPGTEFRAHMPARDLKQILGDEVWSQYYKFANVRNPYDVAVSAYFDQKPYLKEELTFEQWWKRQYRRDWIWSVIEVDDEPAVDYVIRYENLLEDVEHVCGVLGIEFDEASFPKLRNTERPSIEGVKLPYKDLISEAALIEDIGTVFHRTLTEFGYKY